MKYFLTIWTQLKAYVRISGDGCLFQQLMKNVLKQVCSAYYTLNHIFYEMFKMG